MLYSFVLPFGENPLVLKEYKTRVTFLIGGFIHTHAQSLW